MRRTASVAAAVVVAGAVVAAAALGGSAARGPAPRGFSVSGNVSGLYPGSQAWLRATVRNPYRRPMRLVALKVNVRSPSAACRASNLEVRPFRGRLLIPRRAKRVVRLRARMPVTAAQACAGAVFPLVFRGRAVLR